MNKTHALESTFIRLAYAKAIKAIKKVLKRMFCESSIEKFNIVFLVLGLIPLF